MNRPWIILGMILLAIFEHRHQFQHVAGVGSRNHGAADGAAAD
jgi:hypothetical protein